MDFVELGGIDRGSDEKVGISRRDEVEMFQCSTRPFNTITTYLAKDGSIF